MAIAVNEADEDEKKRLDAGRDGQLYTFFPPLSNPGKASFAFVIYYSFLHFLPSSSPCSDNYMQGERESPSQSRARCTMKGIGRETDSSST